MKQHINPDGYLAVTLTRGKTQRTYLVHRLVLESFVGTSPKGMQACHFPNKNHTCNMLDNLMWGTNKLNAIQRRFHRKGLHKWI